MRKKNTQLPSVPAVAVQQVVGCDVCRTNHPVDDVTHLGIYVAGSEGVNVCLQCRQVLTEVLRGMMRAEHAGMKRGYLACKKIQEAKASNADVSASGVNNQKP